MGWTEVDGRPSQAARLLAASLVGLFGAAFALAERLRVPAIHSDFSPVWFGAKALLHHRNPYVLVGPALEFRFSYPLYYPGTALVAAIPFTLLSETVATVTFIFLSAWLLGYGMTQANWNRIWMIPSASFIIASRAAQWSPLMAAAFFVPSLGWSLCCKPTIGLAILGSTSQVRLVKLCVGGALLLLGVSLLLLPSWPQEWLRTIAGNELTSPITRLGGPVLLVSALRLKRPEGRLLLLLALIPQTSSWYEGLMPMLVAQSRNEVRFLSLISSVGYLLQIPLLTGDNYISAHNTGALMVAFCYLPAAIVVLRKPNEGPAPALLNWIRRLSLTGIQDT